MQGRFLKCCFPVLLFILLLPFSSSARPAPPKELDQLFNYFMRLENAYESGRWEKALALADEISGRFANVMPELEKEVKLDVTGSFIFIMNHLKGAIISRNVEDTHKYFVVLQMLIFHIMDRYEYSVPPVLSIIRQYIDEASGARAEGDLFEVEREVNEIEVLFSKVEEQLETKGVDGEDIRAFRKELRDIRVLVQKGKIKEVAGHIDALRSLCGTFIERFQQP